jgi:hypothetical protein
MSRQIESHGTIGQNYAEALRKLIPAEVLIFYFSLVAALPKDLIPTIALTAVAVLITPIYLYFPGAVRRIKQIVLSTLSMIIYTILFGSLAEFIPESFTWIPTLITITWTFVIPFFFMSDTQKIEE